MYSNNFVFNNSYNNGRHFNRSEVEKINEYKSENRPMLTSHFDDGCDNIIQYCYRDGIVIEEIKENGQIFDCYRMLDEELDKLLEFSDEFDRVMNPIIEGAMKWKKPIYK